MLRDSPMLDIEELRSRTQVRPRHCQRRSEIPSTSAVLDRCTISRQWIFQQDGRSWNPKRRKITEANRLKNPVAKTNETIETVIIAIPIARSLPGSLPSL